MRVPVPDGDVDRRLLDGVAEAFHAEHRGLYGYDFAGDPSQQVEWVNLRVSGIGPITRPEIRRLDEPLVEEGALAPVSRPRTSNLGLATGLDGPPRPAVRPVCFDAGDGYVDTPIHQRKGLVPGRSVSGPAVIEEYGSTVPLHPGFTATVDELGNLLVRRAS